MHSGMLPRRWDVSSGPNGEIPTNPPERWGWDILEILWASLNCANRHQDRATEFSAAAAEEYQTPNAQTMNS